MKKIVCLLIVLSLVIIDGVCLAQIKKTKDDFTGNVDIYSQYTLNEGFINNGFWGMNETQYFLIKSLNQNDTPYTIKIDLKMYGNPSTDTPAFGQNAYLKIGEKIYTLNLIGSEYKHEFSDLGDLKGTYEIPLEVVDMFKDSNVSVILRTEWNHTGESSNIKDFKLPKSLIREWKRVIIAE
ncbi:MAG: hypothetical protein H6Q70_1881 [Firmicutes bacterium]|nr:hypothetical protein [Bacillota bacterium]